MSTANNHCKVYGCLRVSKPGVTASVLVDGETHVIEICDYHQAFFEDAVPGLYSLGLTFTQEIEIRVHPSLPTPPA